MTRGFKHVHGIPDSFMNRLDVRVKFLSAVLFILILSLTGSSGWLLYAGYGLFIVVEIALSGLPPLRSFKRSLAALPFVLVVAVFIPFMRTGDVVWSTELFNWTVSVTSQGLAAFASIMLKAWLSVLALIVLVSTTEMSKLLIGLEQLRCPRILITTFSFMYRFFYLLDDEFTRMRQARDSRYFSGGWLWQLSTIGNMVGTLFIRSYERGERVYAAMISRGFDGQAGMVRASSIRTPDIIFAVCAAIYLLAWLGLGRFWV